MKVPAAEAGEMFMHPPRSLPHRGEYGWPRSIMRGIHDHAAGWLDVDGDAAAMALRLPTYCEPNDLLTVVDAPVGFMR